MLLKSFLPKICAIPAAAIPISLLNAVGHVPLKVRASEGRATDTHLRHAPSL